MTQGRERIEDYLSFVIAFALPCAGGLPLT